MPDPISDPNVVVIPKGAKVRFEGGDSEYGADQLLTRDQHLTQLNKVHETYSEAKAVADLLKTDEGANQLATSLLNNGYGHETAFELLKNAGSGDQGGDQGESKNVNALNNSTPGAGADGSLSPAFAAALARQEQQIQQMMSVIASQTANLQLRDEMAALKALDPNADPAKLAETAMRLRGKANLEDAHTYEQAAVYKKQLDEANAKIERMRLEAALPGISEILGDEPPAERTVLKTEADQDTLLKQIIAEEIKKANP